jgi:beta-xylosidase
VPILKHAYLASLAALLLPFTAPAAVAPSFVPVLKENFPDPSVIEHQGTFIAYSTNAGINLPMATSRDLVNWQMVMDPKSPKKRLDGMPQLASWVKEGLTWAPDVIDVGGHWLLYYTARHRKKDIQCIGVATSASPLGPFRDFSSEPLVCQDKLGGSIDADAFRDRDGKLYLYFKSDGNAVGKGTVIWGQRLADDGMSLAGEPVGLVKDDAAWEWRLVEAPMMVRSPGGYQLFFSAAYFGWNEDQSVSPYATGYANCKGPLGPCTGAPENPILHSFKDRQAGCLSGPGHPSIFDAGGRSYMAFHAWAATSACRKAKDERYLYLAPLFWSDGKPQIGMSLRPSGKKK